MRHSCRIRLVWSLAAACAASGRANAQAHAILYSIDYRGPTVSTADSTCASPITAGDVLTPPPATFAPAYGPLAAPSLLWSAGAPACAAGDVFCLQTWYRDPTPPLTDMSDALQITMCP